MHRATAREARTVAEYRGDLVRRLALGMLSLRLSEVSQVPGGPLVSASAGRRARRDQLTSPRCRPRCGRGARQGHRDARDGAGAFVKFGFTPPELTRQKTNTLRGFERAIAERDRQSSAALAAEYVRHVTRGESVPGLDWEYDITKRILPGVTMPEVNAAIAAVLAEDNRVVTVAAPARAGVPAPTPAADLRRACAGEDGGRDTVGGPRQYGAPPGPRSGARKTLSRRRPTSEPASPSGRCPTAPAWCSNRRTSGKTRSSSAR